MNDQRESIEKETEGVLLYLPVVGTRCDGLCTVGLDGNHTQEDEGNPLR